MDWSGFAALIDEWPDEYDDIDCTMLDPDDEDERRIGLAAAHADVDFDPTETNIDLHLAAHEVVANQLIADEPVGVRAVAERLLDEGFEDHDVLHMIGSVVMEHLREILDSKEPFDVDAYLADLDELPEAWLKSAPVGFLDDDFARPFEHAAGRVEALLRDEGPLDVEVLAERAGLGAHDPRDVWQWLVWHEEFAHVLPDGRVAHEQRALDGVVLVHELSDEERAAGRLDATDHTLLLVIKPHHELPLAGGGGATIHTRASLTGERTRASDDADMVVWTLEGPPGWLDRCATSQHVALRWQAGALHVEPATVDEIAADEAASALAAAFAAREAIHDELVHSDDGAFEMTDLLLDVLVAAPEVLRRPTAPVPELVRRSGLSQRGDWVSAGDYDWDARDRRRHARLIDMAIRGAGVHPRDHGRARRLIEQVETWCRGERADARTLARAGSVLQEPGMAVAAHGALGRYERPTAAARLAEVAATIAVATGQESGGAHLLAALAADHAREGARASSHLHAALASVVDPDDVADLALVYLLVEGDLARASRYVQADEDDWELVSLLGPFRVNAGRNDPCPCGSGRKTKQCHGRPGGPPSTTDEQAALVHLKAGLLLERAKGIVIVAALQHLGWDLEGDDQPTARRRRIAVDLALFEGGGLDTVLTGWGELFPADERALLESWRGTSIEVVDGALTRPLPVANARWRPWSLAVGHGAGVALLETLGGADHLVAADAIAPLLERDHEEDT